MHGGGQRNRIMMGNSALAFSQKHFGWQVKWQAEADRGRERDTRETLMRLANCQRGAQKVSIEGAVREAKEEEVEITF